MWHNTMNTLMQLRRIKRAGILLTKVREKRWYVVYPNGPIEVALFDMGPYATRREAIDVAVQYIH